MGLVEGKVIIVTGASSGIGEKTAEVLAAEGAKVVLAARRKEKLEDVANRIIAAGGEAYTVSGDVSVREDCDRIAEETVKKYGRIDVLVNNAGIGDKQMAITRCSDEWWRQIIAVNQDSVHSFVRSFPPHYIIVSFILQYSWIIQSKNVSNTILPFLGNFIFSMYF